MEINFSASETGSISLGFSDPIYILIIRSSSGSLGFSALAVKSEINSETLSAICLFL